MDYFSALAERVIEAPLELRPRIATEFEGQSADGTDWEEITEEVVAPKHVSVEATKDGSAEARGDADQGGPTGGLEEGRTEGVFPKHVSMEAGKPGSEEAPSKPVSPQAYEPADITPKSESPEAPKPDAEIAPKTIGPQASKPAAQEPRIVRIPAPKAQPVELPSNEKKGRRDEPSHTVVRLPGPDRSQPTEERQVGPPAERERIRTVETVRERDRIIHVPVAIDRPEPEEDRPEPEASHPKPQAPRPKTQDPAPKQPQPAIQVQLAPVEVPGPREIAAREPEPERNVVEIHIGRIEVRPPAAPPPKPTSKPSRSRLNLDEMLSRKRGGR